MLLFTVLFHYLPNNLWEYSEAFVEVFSFLGLLKRDNFLLALRMSLT